MGMGTRKSQEQQEEIWIAKEGAVRSRVILSIRG